MTTVKPYFQIPHTQTYQFTEVVRNCTSTNQMMFIIDGTCGHKVPEIAEDLLATDAGFKSTFTY